MPTPPFGISLPKPWPMSLVWSDLGNNRLYQFIIIIDAGYVLCSSYSTGCHVGQIETGPDIHPHEVSFDKILLSIRVHSRQ